eukprot:Blabericola_migrator_1__13181@NODE_904_length_6135_cov_68_019281_g633_i0_p9_GENE_NODE_904_length_6135_cov_68_019281_g633_i0NODE_904_length_6135_cov_68_019281_g633_i0_p9_ORF_typecomplete_len115_score17_40_NODE_904_length_6135_cov_68_019281_g633_i030283372
MGTLTQGTHSHHSRMQLLNKYDMKQPMCVLDAAGLEEVQGHTWHSILSDEDIFDMLLAPVRKPFKTLILIGVYSVPLVSVTSLKGDLKNAFDLARRCKLVERLTSECVRMPLRA